jgi:putative hemolysin
VHSVLHSNQSILSSTSTFVVKIADSLEEIEAALRLRFEVFNLELQEGLQSSYESGFDSDVYDTFCDHLIVKEKSTGKVVGTYRLLPQSKAGSNLGFYSENEFDLSNFKKHPGKSLELGRSCVAKEFRSLTVINLLWAGISRYVELHSITHLFGCASFHSNNSKEIATAFAYLSLFHSAPTDYHVKPLEKCAMNLPYLYLTSHDIKAIYKQFPPLVKGYLRLGAMICGEPAYDKEFGTTDFLIVVDTKQIADKYKDHYLKSVKAA